MSFAIVTQPTADRTTRRISAVGLVLVMLLVGLAGLAVFSEVATTVIYGPSWVAGYVLTLLSLLAVMALSLSRQRAKVVAGSAAKKVGLERSGGAG